MKRLAIPFLLLTTAAHAGAVDIWVAPAGSGSSGISAAGTGTSTAADDTVPVSDGSNWAAKALPSCSDSAGNHLNYTTASNAFSCGVSIPTLTLAGSQFANQGTTTQVLHGNAAGNPSWGAVAIGTDVSGLGAGVGTLLGGASSGTGGPAGTTSPTFTAPVLGVFSSTSGSATTTDASTNTVTNLLTLEHDSSGTPAASFGSGILFNGQSTTTTGRNMAQIAAIWTTATDATRTAAIDFKTQDTNFGYTSLWRMTANTPCCSTEASFGPAASTTTYIGAGASGWDFVTAGAYGAFINGLGFHSLSTGQFSWSTTSSANGAADTGIARDSAGVMRVTDGSSGTAAVKFSAATQTGKTTTYNNVATAGWGHPAIYAAGRTTAQTAANTSIATYTVGAADGSFIVSGNVLVTVSSAENFNLQITYTDEGNTARTVNENLSLVAGTLGTAVLAANGAVPYEGIPVHIRAKASTAITVKTAGTFTGATYNAEGVIQQIQ